MDRFDAVKTDIFEGSPNSREEKVVCHSQIRTVWRLEQRYQVELHQELTDAQSSVSGSMVMMEQLGNDDLLLHFFLTIREHRRSKQH